MSKLVIVESPTKAKTIKKYLRRGYDVKASMGHVRDLHAKRLSVDVDRDFEPSYTVIKGKEKLVKELADAAGKCDEVFIATDPDREGEAIAWHLATLLGLDPKVTKRVKFNEINRSSVEHGIAHPDLIDMDLVNAQQARRILDRLVGYKLSPFISQKIHRGLSAGRVQSVAVRLIVDREEEIASFQKEEYWSLTAKLTVPPARKVFAAALVSDENGKVQIGNEEQANAYLARLDGASYKVAKVKKGQRRKQPYPPFTTSTLQQEASHKLGFTSSRTMRIAQELYEGIDVEGYGSIGLITYMRTDSLRISEESRAQGNEFIRETYGDAYLPEKPRYFKNKSRIQDGHEAIRPTVPGLTPARAKASLSPEQYKLYDLIWKRFIASLMAPCVQNTKKVDIEAATDADRANGKICVFTVSGFTVKFDGFTALYQDASDEDQDGESVLPEMSEGELLKLRELVPEQHFTQPPPRYTEASLIKMLEETGIGRPSTYATIISTITARSYVVREQKQLKPTELGVAVTKLLEKEFPKIVNTKFTAGMESELDEVEAGKLDYVKMLHVFYDDFADTLSKAKADMQGVKIQLEEDKTDVVCDKCGRLMVVKVGRYGKFLACPGYPACRNTKPFVTETDAKCPKCGGNVISRKTKRGYTFYGCSNYPTCDFMTWDKPTKELCPNCGSYLFKTRGSTARCLKDGCGYEKKVSSRRKKDADGDA